MGRTTELFEKTLRSALSSEASGFFRFRIDEALPSTNATLKEDARAGEKEGLVRIALSQTHGTGRLGRSFYSPRGAGLYMSFLLRPEISSADARYLTPCAAVAVSRALETVSGKPNGIKWVNDIYMEDKKVSGILTEAGISLDGTKLSWAVVGIGVDLYPPDEGFPAELRDLVGTVFEKKPVSDPRPVLAAKILSEFLFLWNDKTRAWMREYREKSVLDGKRVLVRHAGSNETEEIPATALEILWDGSLLVRYDDGQEETLSSGEVARPSVHIK